MTKYRLLFRADGSASIGLGHIVRLQALANILRDLAPCLFLVREPSAAVTQLLEDTGQNYQALPDNRSLIDEAEWLTAHFLQPTDVLVLDGYDFDEDYQLRLQRSGCGLVAVDDLHIYPVVADVLINHSPGIAPTDYHTRTTTQLLLGPAFSLLRQPFLTVAEPPQPIARPTSILVCFGGADPLRFTERVLTALLEVQDVRTVGLVIGNAYGETLKLEQVAEQQSGKMITIYRSVDATTLAKLLRTHDVAIVPASTVLIEALVLGRPVITGFYVDNQRSLANYVHTHQQAFSVGNFADLEADSLVTALRQGLHFHQNFSRQPYVDHLKLDELRGVVQQLLHR